MSTWRSTWKMARISTTLVTRNFTAPSGGRCRARPRGSGPRGAIQATSKFHVWTNCKWSVMFSIRFGLYFLSLYSCNLFSFLTVDKYCSLIFHGHLSIIANSLPYVNSTLWRHRARVEAWVISRASTSAWPNFVTEAGRIGALSLIKLVDQTQRLRISQKYVFLLLISIYNYY